MSGPTELSFDEILKFMLTHNGKVTNHELVKYFKVFLTNPDMRDEARSTFKKHVNSLAIIKNHNNEKWLILKKKYIPSNGKESGELLTENVVSEPLIRPVAESSNDESSMEPIPPRPPLPLHLNQDFSILNTLMQNNSTFQASLEPEHLVPEPQQSPIEQVAPSEQISTNIKNDPVPSPLVDLEAPKINPRRKSTTTTEKNVSEKQPSLMQTGHRTTTSDQDNVKNETITSSKSENMLVDGEQKISVKERKQMFNRMASEGDMLRTHPSGGLNNSQGIDEEDRASVISLDHKGESDPLDSKQKAWILCAARGEYHALAKMCSENAKLTRTKDPFTGYTAMHWACKRGDENLVKLLAGVSRNIVNERSNGGYTPLHIAMQFRHENVYKLLVDVYDADSTLRDWAGKKARQYLVHMDTSLSPGSYRKKESFLRIGSLNVRVKKTTEAFSNFLGVGATRSSAYVPKSARMDDRRDDDQLHKTWGSADNIAPKDDKLMPPPPSSKIRRRGTSGRKGLSAAHSRSTPSTPDQPRAHLGVKEEGDSDSDSAAGFHAAWRHQRASDCL